ncbi:bifunctional phosphoribosylaminoimidazolecarboxamide formyltransferase/IMP cyclohydrolase [bacterium]|nr:bifunctional phosphoribosylaminoimidazolecarboxamide formyltransferase/IMP cyclohydrolase [bacterium]
MIAVKRALLSVSDKTDLVGFATGLADAGVELISTGGTTRALLDAGLSVRGVSDFTGSPEILDGRVKTLHPKVHGAILARRDLPEHRRQVERYGLELIDMVVVNLYPFQATVARPDCTLEQAIENIDIGGPSMIRSAAKNWNDVAVVTDPADYQSVLDELRRNRGFVSRETCYRLAVKAFLSTARYDRAIALWLEGRERRPAPRLVEEYELVQSLRYGENPHQSAAFYRRLGAPGGLPAATVHHGKTLSYNNLLDLDAALCVLRDFEAPTAVILKHNNPCGLASHERSIEEALRAAHACDPVSAFGGVVGVNRPVDARLAAIMLDCGFLECVLAPAYQPEALEALKGKKNLRIVELAEAGEPRREADRVCRPVEGGLLVQDRDRVPTAGYEMRVVTKAQPNPAQLASLAFAFKACKQVKSNAIVLVQGTATVGIGAGQMSRVDSSRLAVLKAGDRARGAVLASDAFFPFRDGVDAAAEAGVTAIIQPGGSVRDEEVIAAADEHKIPMIFTGVRHFRH